LDDVIELDELVGVEADFFADAAFSWAEGSFGAAAASALVGCASAAAGIKLAARLVVAEASTCKVAAGSGEGISAVELPLAGAGSIEVAAIATPSVGSATALVAPKAGPRAADDAESLAASQPAGSDSAQQADEVVAMSEAEFSDELDAVLESVVPLSACPPSEVKNDAPWNVIGINRARAGTVGLAAEPAALLSADDEAEAGLADSWAADWLVAAVVGRSELAGLASRAEVCAAWPVGELAGGRDWSLFSAGRELWPMEFMRLSKSSCWPAEVRLRPHA
jgi:hypothetical protein